MPILMSKEESEKRRRKRNKEYNRIYRKKVYELNKEKIAEYYKKNKERLKKYSREHRKLVQPIIGICPICQIETKLCNDHDHKTLEFRGYICNSCNLGLGHFKDNIESLKKAIVYLEALEKK